MVNSIRFPRRQSAQKTPAPLLDGTTQGFVEELVPLSLPSRCDRCQIHTDPDSLGNRRGGRERVGPRSSSAH